MAKVAGALLLLLVVNVPKEITAGVPCVTRGVPISFSHPL
jgi:hypothetical protein